MVGMHFRDPRSSDGRDALPRDPGSKSTRQIHLILYAKGDLRGTLAPTDQVSIEELEGLLLRKALEEPHEGYLVDKAKPVMRVPAPAELHEIFLGQGRGPLEPVRAISFCPKSSKLMVE